MSTRKNSPQPWTYRGVLVTPAGRNASGIRWHAFSKAGQLRADTKVSMRHLITYSLAKG